MRNLLLSFAVPAGVLVPAVIAWQQFPDLPELIRALLPYGPYGVALGGMALAWMFNRSGAFFLLLLLASVHSVLRYVLPGEGAGDLDPKVIYLFMTVLLPLNVAVFALLGERGILTWRGGLRLGFLGLQVLLVAASAWFSPAWPSRLADYDMPWLSEHLVSPIPQPAAVLFLLAVGVLLVRLLLHRTALDGALVGALLSTQMAMHVAEEPLQAALFLTASALMLMVAIVLDSYHMAYVDELTGLPARRALREDLMKLGAHYAIAMVDVDHFKKFNDRYGHHAGDQVLRMVASRLAQVSGGGKAFRYGGEEFTLVFPGKALHEIEPHLEALRTVIAASWFALRAKDRPKRESEGGAGRGRKPSRESRKVAVTVSIGSAESSERYSTPAEVLRAADRSLYWAKKLGRNRVCS